MTMASSVVGFLPHEQMFHRTEMTSPLVAKVSDFDRIGDLGKGGLARVSKVRQHRCGTVFALKEAFHPSPDDEAEKEVLRRVAGSPSPYVVHCLAAFPGEDGCLTSVLEFMDAGSLLHVLHRRGRRGIPEPPLAEVAWRCLTGLAHLHSRGVAHLDVKPENFLANSRGEVKIADFNTAGIFFDRRSGENLQVRTDVGTIDYFSPERFVPNSRGAAAADVWGLGLTILELFMPDAEVAKLEDWKEVIVGSQEPPSEASAELRDFLGACMQMDPARRPLVSRLLKHPYVTRRDSEASSRALRDLIVETL